MYVVQPLQNLEEITSTFSVNLQINFPKLLHSARNIKIALTYIG